MSNPTESFDPYHKWLGIPPEDQPSTHYRLLGVRAFEDDLDVISNAADRAMGHVRTFQSGKNANISQQLLNELSAARLCLLSPDQKNAYDKKLKQTQPNANTSVPPPFPGGALATKAPSRIAQSMTAASTDKQVNAYKSRGRTAARRKKHKKNNHLVAIITLLAILAAVTAIAFIVLNKDTP